MAESRMGLPDYKTWRYPDPHLPTALQEGMMSRGDPNSFRGRS